MSKLVRISAEEALDFNYPESCLRGKLRRWDFWLVDRRRRARMRRLAKKARRAGHARFLAQVAEINACRERMKRDVGYFLEVCGIQQPSNHPAVLALLEVLAERGCHDVPSPDSVREGIVPIPYKEPSPSFFEMQKWWDDQYTKLYGNEVSETLIGLGERDG